MNRLLTLGLLGALVGVGSASAQRRDGPPPDPAQRQAFLMDIMGTQLNLSKEQRAQLQTILDKGTEAAKPVHEQVTKTREALRNAIKEGKTGPVLDAYHKQLGHQYAQLVAIESKTFTEIYAMLTPDQKATSDVAYYMLGMLMAPPRPGGDRRGFGGSPKH